MPDFRITFSPKANAGSRAREKHYDVTAKNSDEAFQIAYQKPETDSPYYQSIGVQEIPKQASPIGIHFKYLDTFANKTYSDYLIIKADSEEQAKDYYNQHLKGKRFWFDAGKPEPDGKHEYQQILDTYFATCPGFHFDATKPKNTK